MHDWLTGIWYGSRPGGGWLVPLSWLFAGSAAVRRVLYRRGILPAWRAPCPVIVVGNITAGGTGKTPLVIWLADRLAERGLVVGIASRGYGGSDTRSVREVARSDAAGRVGDEPLLMARRTNARVVVGRRRTDVVRHLAGAGVDVVICDDGLQHYALARDIEVAVIDGERRFGNGRLLPAGPLREPAARLRDIEWVFSNGGRARDGEIAMGVEGLILHRVGSDETMPIDALDSRRCHAVAGIGNPQRFFDSLEAAGVDVVPHPLPDHASADVVVDRLPADETVIMTEKDAVKYSGSGRQDVWYLPVDARPGAEADRLLEGIVELCRKKDPDSGRGGGSR